MRRITVLEFMSLDGVIQGPGGPEEDPSGGFRYGGWTVPYFDDDAGKLMAKQMAKRADLLLGRKTYDIFASYWPEHERDWPGINDVTKYAVSKTLKQTPWRNSVVLRSVSDIRNVKRSKGPDLAVYGSSVLVRSLLKHDLVDELWLKIFPVVLGKGKRLFDDATPPSAYELVSSKTTSAGVIFASYRRAGTVKTGSFDPQ